VVKYPYKLPKQGGNVMEKEKFYQKTWFVILMLIVFAPLGIFLMWKYKTWGKAAKIIVTVIFCFVFIGQARGYAGGNKEAPTTDTKTVAANAPVSSAAQAVTSQATASKEETKQADNKANIEDAKKVDTQMWDAILSAEQSYQQMIDAVNKGSQGEADDLTVYDTCKDTKSTLSSLQLSFPSTGSDEGSDYQMACLTYIANANIIADDIIKYMDKSEMKYLSDAKDYIGRMDASTLDIISKRMTFLQSAGLTDEEIKAIVSPESK